MNWSGNTSRPTLLAAWRSPTRPISRPRFAHRCANCRMTRKKSDPTIPRFHRLTKKLAGAGASDSCRGMIRGGFLDPGTRADLIALVRDGKAETRLTRRANALLLLDDGTSCAAIAKVLYLDDDTIRYSYQLYGEKGLNWLADFGYKGRRSEERRVGNECRSVV